MQVKPHVYVMHIDDGAVTHPGGSNNYFVGDPKEDMALIDCRLSAIMGHRMG